MPPFHHPLQIPAALRNQAIPALEYLAANNDARNSMLSRFERDEPPPYVSSTESEEFDDGLLTPQPDTLPEELQTIVDQPLDQREKAKIAHNLGSWVDGASRYRAEARLEEFRLTRYMNHNLFRGEYGKRRLRIMIRHNIKRRWSKLGVWNPEWGIPGRLNEQPEDEDIEWMWKWEHDITGEHQHGKHLVRRALDLRQNLRRGETCPVQPHSHLQLDATASQAESFIISRPWFTWNLDVSEESSRIFRLPLKYQHGVSALKNVGERWKKRGDWRERDLGHLRPSPVYSWKWRHESPSPEPEDLSPLTYIKDSPLDAIDVDFTPSETDAFEAFPPPSPEFAWKGNYIPHSPDRGIFAPLELPEQKDETFAKQQPNDSGLSPPEQESRRYGQRKGQRKTKPSMGQTPRRSARIAALKMPTKLRSSQTSAGNKIISRSSVTKVATRRDMALQHDKEQEALSLLQLRLQRVSNARWSTHASVKSPSATQPYRTRSGRVSKPPVRRIL